MAPRKLLIAAATLIAATLPRCDCGGSTPGDDGGTAGDGSAVIDAASDASSGVDWAGIDTRGRDLAPPRDAAPVDAGPLDAAARDQTIAHPDSGPSCVDDDSDGRGPGCDLGTDCDPANPNVWEACVDCVDVDTDGWWIGCDAFATINGPDCDDGDSAAYRYLTGFEDQDGDGYSAGPADQPQQICSGTALPTGYVDSSLGIDCNDNDAAHGASCGFYLVKDLNVLTDDTPSSAPHNFVYYSSALGQYVLFSADDGVHGRELWKTSGPGGATVLVADLVPGSAGISVGEVRQFSTGAYVVIDDGEHGAELWFTRGSAATTRLVKDICPGDQSSNPRELTKLGSTLFFLVDSCSGGKAQLFKSDGTEAGTNYVGAPRFGNGDAAGAPKWLTVVGNALYFATEFDWYMPAALFKSDGTAAGTVAIYDIGQPPVANAAFETRGLTAFGDRLVAVLKGVNTVNGSYMRSVLVSMSGPQDRVLVADNRFNLSDVGRVPMATVGTRVFFTALGKVGSPEQDTGNELWASNLTDAGTQLVKNICAAAPRNSDPAGFLPFDSNLYFTADDCISGREVWRSNGTLTGTVRVADLNNGAATSDPQLLTRLGNYLYFTADDGISGRELWRSSGSSAGTTRVGDLMQGDGSSGIVEINAGLGLLLFNGNGDRTGYERGDELWSYDPANATDGIGLVADIDHRHVSSDPQPILVDNGRLLFAADDRPNGDSSHGVELWLSDGTAGNPTRLKDINPGSGDANPGSFIAFNGAYYFSATDGTAAGGHGRELWRTDLTEAGTTLVADIRPGTASSDPTSLIDVSGTLFFTANDGTAGSELWKSDGTTNGTVRVRDIRSGASSSNPSQLFAYNGELFFSADDGTTGVELWHSGGSSINTTRVSDINTGAAGSSPTQFTLYHGVLYFTATTSSNGSELWATTGTNATTQQVEDINPGAASSNPSGLSVLLDRLVFAADDVTNGVELWRSDGTSGGTMRVKNINPAAASSNPGQFALMGNYVYFTATTAAEGTELWRSNLDTTSTTLVKNIESGASSSDPTSLQVINGVLYFNATTAASGRELYRSDGTSAGTAVIKDICTGACHALPSGLFLLPDNVTMLFSATDRYKGIELWATDGTMANTRLLQDLWSGPSSSSPGSFVVVGDRLLFTAMVHEYGRELWAIALNEI